MKILRHIPTFTLLIGLCALGAGITALNSAPLGPQEDSHVAVLKQRLADYIEANDRINATNQERLDSLEASFQTVAAQLESVKTTETMLVAQEDKIIFAMWGMVIGLLGIFAERLASRVFSSRRERS